MMKAFAVIAALLLASYAYYDGTHYHSPQFSPETFAPLSNCYVPGEALKPGQHPCVTIDEVQQ
jgi:hypothetical protein